MKVTLKFIGLGYNDNFQAHIKIYDKCKLLYEEDTYNGIISLCLDKNKVYRVVVYTLYNELDINLLIDRDTYRFYFYYYNIEESIITFQLLDAFYSGLKIERGNLLLWQKQ